MNDRDAALLGNEGPSAMEVVTSPSTTLTPQPREAILQDSGLSAPDGLVPSPSLAFYLPSL